MKKYGEALKENRTIRGYTLKDIEKATGINNGNISRWERGEVIPNIDFCVKLADFYGITVDELIGREINGENMK
jgi:transcriptional regulator with XRE-family HTH domain